MSTNTTNYIAEKLCNGEPFWDDSLTWTNSSWPQFTECFQRTILTWTSCGFLWLCTPFYIYHLLSQRRQFQPIRLLFCIKIFFTLAMIALHIVEAFDIFRSKKSAVSKISPVIWISTLFIQSYLIYLERTRKKVRSPILFSFWILVAIVSSVPFYSTIILETYASDVSFLPLDSIRFAVALFCIVINCFPDYVNRNNKEGKHPETYSSLLAWLFFFWFERLVYKGFKSKLGDEDIFNLHSKDRTEKTMEKFLGFWNKEIHKQIRKKVNKKYILDENWETEIPLLPITNIQNHPDQLVTSVDESDEGADESAFQTTTDVNSSDLENQPEIDFTDHRKNLSEEIGAPHISLKKTMIKCYWRELVSSQSGMIMNVIANIFSPIVLGLLINFTKDKSEYSWHGYSYAALFILLRILFTIFVNISKWFNNRFASRVQCTAIAMVFRKSLTISNEARKTSTTGEIINLMSIDPGNIELMLIGSFWCWVSSILIVFGVYLLYTIVGLAMLAGLGFMVLLFIMNILASQKMRRYQEIIMSIKDERMKVMNEILNGIKVIKLYGWEPMFIKRIQDVREKELQVYFKYCILAGFESFTWHVSSVWTLYFMLVTYVMTSESHYLGAATVFLTINYANIIKSALNILPAFVGDLVKALNSLTRMNKYLNSEKINSINLIRNKSDPVAVRIKDCDFAWLKAGPINLKNINLEVSPGELIAVVGPVGCGKSSLLFAVLGEMHKLNGYFNLNSSVAYVPQQAWIQNNTLKENILFGKKFDYHFFQKVIDASALTPDLEMMPAGAETEIGEKGINLSGGQKQRVSLARAIYSQADIYLLDDPLSAVDSHVGKHIFEQVLGRNGLLFEKTRILVTHGIHWLPFVDRIVVMFDGQITESGTYEDLLSHNGPFSQFLIHYMTQNIDHSVTHQEEDNLLDVKCDILRRLASVASEGDCSAVSEELVKIASNNSINISTSNFFASNNQLEDAKSSTKNGILKSKENITELNSAVSAKNRLTTDEKLTEGKVQWSIYYRLIQSLGLNNSILILFLFISYQITFNFCHFWLADWSDDASLNNFTQLPAESNERKDLNIYYIGVFTGLTFLMTICDIFYAVVFQIGHLKASRTFHNNLLTGIMHASISFFDTTPIGRILNRFSQDIESVDSNIFIEIETVLDNSLKCISTLIVVSYTMPIFLSVVVPLVIILYFIQQLYIRTSCQIRRIVSKNRSPIYAHFSETLSGASVIRAYQEQNRFIADSVRKVDDFQKSYLVYKGLNRWLESHLGLLSCVISTAATLFAVAFKNDLSPGLVGLAVTYALRVSNDMNVLTLVFGNLENHIVSLERIIEYTTLDSEAPWDNESLKDEWLTEGTIELINYSTRYREGLNLVLKNISCIIKGGEKVGIVGRTGAGKSSMMLSLFRLIEAVEGKILVDGVDIASLGLHSLRKKLTILPQDPVLFAGSVRMNLDPFNENSDSEIWRALEHAHLKNFVEELPKTLDYEVGEGGQNLSMGQRQLLCLARTLLRKSKIFILDEATAAVDLETDELIQKTIRKEFAGCTVLTIAHRLNTVMDYDRIMVLEDGQLIEFETPSKLLQDVNSAFFSMASQAGLV